MNSSKTTSRRGFLKTTIHAGAAALAVPAIVPAAVFGANAPSNRINLGAIGAGNKGFDLLKNFLGKDDVQVLAVCDVNRASYGYASASQYLGREPGQKAVHDHYARKQRSGEYKGCDTYNDFRELLARADLDAVVIATPDHWHGLMTVMAAEAGKDIYCEKPLSLTIRQGQEMVKAVRKHKRIFQTGSQERSNPVTRQACELVRNGRIGQLKKITTYVGFHNKVGPGPGWTPMPVPEGFDYDRWLGPAPAVPYHQDRCLYRFRFNYDYSGGQVTNFGAHSNDIAQWALDTDRTGPVEVEFIGAQWLPAGSLFNAALETEFRCRYANGIELLCVTHKEAVGVIFEGAQGMVKVGYGGLSTQPESLKTAKIGANEVHLYRSDDHAANFIECVKTRQEPVAPVEVGHRSATVCHLGVIACRLGKEGKKKPLRWDPEQERFTNDDDANTMLTRPTRPPWRI